MYLSRANYDKVHRCPGSSGPAWRGPKGDRCPDGGYITFGMTYAQYGALDTDGRTFRRYPRAWQTGQCTSCDVVVLPLVTRLLDPTYLAFRLKQRAASLLRVVGLDR